MGEVPIGLGRISLITQPIAYKPVLREVTQGTRIADLLGM